jgi:hypothetical protein
MSESALNFYLDDANVTDRYITYLYVLKGLNIYDKIHTLQKQLMYYHNKH